MRGFIKRSIAKRPHAEPNVIPFIDVLLVLLIIFMVTAPTATTDVQLQLPGPNPVRSPNDVVIVDLLSGVGVRAQVLVDGAETTLDQMPSVALQHGVSLGLSWEDVLDDTHFVVRADQDIAYAHVVAALDALQHAGFAKVAVFSQTAEEA